LNKIIQFAFVWLTVLPLLHGASLKSSAVKSTASGSASVAAITFNRDIRPIFSENCYACHGPDKNKRKAGLRFDQEEGAFASLESGDFAIVRGDPAKSKLLKLVASEDNDERMPPPKTGKRLTKAQIGLLREWIAQGAKWQPHWSYIPPDKLPAITAKDKSWPHTPIDNFILARLEKEKIKPALEADPVTLLRRLSFDLVGLPPSASEIAAFKADHSVQAYERLVDRWLASPHFGERLAIQWLDLVRYGDTEGYHGDQHRDIYLFRDYVIRAFNDNKPFDRFTIEQLAGDLIPEASLEQKIASGYNRVLMTTQEGGAQPKEYLAKYSADRVRNASVVWLASTMGCCECHDHKYDPFKTKDFYSLAAFFADLKEKAVGAQEPFLIPTSAEKEKLDEFDKEKAALQKVLDSQTPELDTALNTWQLLSTDWQVLRPALMSSKNGARLRLLEDGSILASGTNTDKETYTITVQTSLQDITGFRLEVLPDPSLPKNGPGRNDDGNFFLAEFELAVASKTVEWASVSASHSQEKKPASNLIDKKLDTAWGILEQAGQTNEAVFEAKDSIGSATETTLTFNLQQDQNSSNTLGRFRLSATTELRPVSKAIPKDVRPILTILPSDREEKQRQQLAKYFRSQTALLEAPRTNQANVQKQIDDLKAKIVKTLVSETNQPRTIRILARGNWLDDSGAEVQPAVPAFLATLKTGTNRATRMELAKWLVSPDNPLVARVFVNRIWKLFFGQGIVKSLDDFGSQGAAPSHAELLDWLACEFRDSGWDVKHLVKLLVMSATYRQSSKDDPQFRQLDPYNALLAHQGRFHFDAEIVRDNALSISGLLSEKIGGPSVKPYQPAGYWALLNFPKREYDHDKNENQYRRSVYTYWARTFPHPSLLAFDAPSREECTAERIRSNTPQQALVLLNDPIYLEAARVFAERILRDGGPKPESRIQFAFDQALSRRANPTEIRMLKAIEERHRLQYDDDPTAAADVLQIGEHKAPRDLNKAELAAWTSVARVILNLHETITRN